VDYTFGNDVEELFLHELGHAAIGLGHPPWDGAVPDQRVMYVGDFNNPSAPPCCLTVNRKLSNDDIAGAQYVYGIRGDYDGTGVVDAADYVVWRGTLDSTTDLAADGNLNHVVDSGDFGIWRANFGNAKIASGSGTATSAVIPEPGAIELLMIGLAIGRLFCGSRR
jgi:hypothetical protein